MSEVKTFSPEYYGVIVQEGMGDARLICMVQEEDQALSIHFFQVDSTLDDAEFKVSTFQSRDFKSELRGTSLAVVLIEEATFAEARKIIEQHLTDAYGDSASITVNQIERPSILSLFA
ncbi:MAG: hypothetical protein HKN43_17400 [Rhodothermales bacterium]|nr:hypothetical protein [Rhodothermales bacterium]